MGNVNGREDGSSSPSGVEEGESNNSVQEEGMGAPDGLMGQSPPHSPRTTHSPLMFTPQVDCGVLFVWLIDVVGIQGVMVKSLGRILGDAIRYDGICSLLDLRAHHLFDFSSRRIYQASSVPVAPLQRPDEIHIPSHSWMQSSSRYEDVSYEIGIPTMITWSYDGQEVAVEGSWDNWKTRIPLQRSGKDFTIMKVLPSGVYQYRFLVDGQWRYAPDLPWAQDDVGNSYNILDLQLDFEVCYGSYVVTHGMSVRTLMNEKNGVGKEEKAKPAKRLWEGLEYVPEDLESISSFEPPQSPEMSYNNLQLTAEDFAKEPPLVPPHMQMTLLNVPGIQHGDSTSSSKTSACGP
ncbi:hypothetical protein Pint_09424 [Pistacia integerrima]|uniref:Uncharacterized protein n=1 Tax=Pistacia integerrima TaxID=434235 RepID=A0ACC0XF34_9ROSI|nr:hypothetical protein Pint_09424 [Pistacia integerrima]